MSGTPGPSFEPLASALGDDAPAGPDLSYDAAFIALEAAGAGKPEREYGDKLFPAEPPDWAQVHEHALDLAARTRDLRVAVWLARAATHRDGVLGAAAGLALVERLVATQWASVHPTLDPDDGLDPTFRLSALAPLFAPASFVADVRGAALAPVRGAPTARAVELAFGAAAPRGDESVPTRDGLVQALAALYAEHAEAADAARALDATARALQAALEQQVGAAHAPDARPLLALTGALRSAVAAASGEAPDAEPAPDGSAADAAAAAPAGSAASGPAGVRGEIRSRDDAVAELERVCVWLERHDPSNPAPLLIRRAQRLISKSFLDILRDLAPDAYEQVARLSGVADGG